MFIAEARESAALLGGDGDYLWTAEPACREGKHDEAGVDGRPFPPAGSHLPRRARHHLAMYSDRTFAAPSGSLVGWRFSAFCQE